MGPALSGKGSGAALTKAGLGERRKGWVAENEGGGSKKKEKKEERQHRQLF